MLRNLLLAVLLLVLPAARAVGQLQEDVTFETHVRPILKAHCWHCHGEGDELEGSLDARLARTLKEGGDSGAAIVPGDHSESLLFQRIAAGEMPPGERKPTSVQIDLIARWIDQGAKTVRQEPATLPPGQVFSDEERNHWSFQPIQRPRLPAVRDTKAVQTPIDAFLLAALEIRGLEYSPPADRSVLIRRLSFDLTGLPPPVAAVEQFVTDPRPDAYERLVDGMLASPAYGEHWARHWLDVVGYADSDGYTAIDRPRKWAFRYRDYVIRAFNEDKPWNEFLIEQLAGDELLPTPLVDPSPDEAKKLIATGMVRMAPDGTSDGSVDPNVARNDVIANTVRIVSSALLGMTVGCAQCHDHRYDPISQADYHRIRAIFEPAYDWTHWRTADERLVNLWSRSVCQEAATVEAELNEIARQRDVELDRIVHTTFERELAKLPAEIHATARAAHETPAEKQTPEQKELIARHPFLNVDRGTVYLFQPDRLTGFNKTWDERTEAARRKMPPADFAFCLTEVPGHVPPTKLFARGDFHSPRQQVDPGELEILNPAPNLIPTDDPSLPTSGRRLAYARHLTDGRHPLVARVLVNRFWMHHFGRGLVSTPGDFGVLGQPPSHPELLDWLAAEFMADGWRLKRLQRMIVTSTVYQQASRRREELDAVDPENRLLGRMNVQRLEAEMLRDALLHLSGNLSGKCYGPPIPITPDEVGQIVVGADTRDSSGRPTGATVDLGDGEFRRSIYVQVQRSRPLGILEVFDAPIMAPNCEQRGSSTNASQSLLLMNNAFVLQQADGMSRRIEREAGSDPAAQFRRAWRMTFCRDPSAGDLDAGMKFLREQSAILGEGPPPSATPAPSTSEHRALAMLCHALIVSNGFLYVE